MSDRYEPITHITDEEDGLRAKYRVFYAEEAEIPEDTLQGEVKAFVFVLKPDSDHHARVALAAYAESVRPFMPDLAADLDMVLETLTETP